VSHVYGFELVGATARLASQNIEANNFARNKVTVTLAGIAASGGTMQLSPTGAGDVGAHLGMQGGAGAETVPLLAIHEVVAECLKKHPGQPLVLKLDCEGAEYEIIESLGKHGLLASITVFMIEWHNAGSAAITSHLRQAGFVCFTHGIEARQPTGFVYAISMAK
jgi:FkbM family methyltransferase